MAVIALLRRRRRVRDPAALSLGSFLLHSFRQALSLGRKCGRSWEERRAGQAKTHENALVTLNVLKPLPFILTRLLCHEWKSSTTMR